MTSRRSLITVVVAIVLLSGILFWVNTYIPRDREPSPLVDVTVQFGWLQDVHHSGFWIAKTKGYYRDVGLSVKLLSGGLGSSPIKSVVSGAALIGQAGGIEQIVAARSEGLPITAIAAFHRHTPHALISLDRNPVRSANDLTGKTVAVAYGDSAEILFRNYLQKTGTDPTRLNLVPFRFDLTPLMSGQVDAITGFSTDQPATLAAKGFKPVVLRYEDAGVRSYGYTLFTRSDTIINQPTVVWRFIEATRKGWEYALSHPEEAVDIMLEAFPGSLTREVEALKMKYVTDLMVDSGGKLASWGLEQSVLSEVLDNLKAQKQISSDIAPNDFVAEKARNWR